MQERGQQVLERKEMAGAGRGGQWGASEDHWAARATGGTSGLESTGGGDGSEREPVSGRVG